MLFNLITGILALNLISSNSLKVQKQNLVFFTGGNSIMPSFIYSNFINKLKDYYNVEIINNLDNKNNQVLEKLLNIYKKDNDFIALSHSSGATSLINYCNKFDISKYILLDPVDNNKLIKNKELEFNNNNKVLILNAEKSFNWNFNSLPKIPFIPIGKLKNNFNNYNEITLKDAGHCDILDDPYSNFMNKNLAEGLSDRDKVSQYQQCLINLINLFTMDNLNNNTVQIIENFDFEYNYKEKLV